MPKITLAAARISAGYTQEKLADKMGVSRASLQAWETGKTEMRPAYLYMFCGITGFTEDDLLLPETSTKR